MTKEIEPIVRSDELVGGTEHIAITPYGVEFDETHAPTINEWLEVVNKVQKVHGMMQFYLGDLMVFAQSDVTGWGHSKYDDLVEASGYDKNSLMVMTSVARRFPNEFRKNILSQDKAFGNVTFTHFRMVQGLPDEHAKYFLEKVAEGRWTVSKLITEVEKYKNKDVFDAYEEAEDEYVEKIPTFGQVTKEMASWAKNFAKENNADMIRVQIVKDGKVIEERITEVY